MVLVCGLFLLTIMWPGGLWAQTEMEALKKQLKELTEMVQRVEKQMTELEAKSEEKEEEIEEVSDRLDQAELHTASDKLSLGVELRSRGIPSTSRTGVPHRTA